MPITLTKDPGPPGDLSGFSGLRGYSDPVLGNPLVTGGFAAVLGYLAISNPKWPLWVRGLLGLSAIGNAGRTYISIMKAATPTVAGLHGMHGRFPCNCSNR